MTDACDSHRRRSLEQTGSEFTLKTLDLADPGPGEVLIERIITTIPFTKINDAVTAQARGEAVKVVLVHR